MFLLRRAAVRALSQHASALPRPFQPVSCRVASFPQSGSASIAWRGFHQARIWRAEEEQKGEIAQEGGASPAENKVPEETVTAEPSPEQQAEVREESIASPEVADAAPEAPADTTSGEVRRPRFAETIVVSEAASSGAPVRPSHDTLSTLRNPRPSRIVYVGNLFFEVTADQLEAEFRKCGEVTNSRIVSDSRGLSKGFGYVEFASQESADQALRDMDQRVLQGRRMAVQYHVPRERRPKTPPLDKTGTAERNSPTKTLFIGNMSYQMSDRDLNDLFREIRDVLDVRVAIDRRSGQPRGFAHADFIDVPSAQRAKEHLERKILYGRQLRVDFSVSSNRSSEAES